ncbi:MAG TPA: zinc ABC transporter substrate-binding protein [Methanocorpusculum sp.]|nr:zinc ABC transporter substrate-binding protein [Methanocorpusculum sp.]
MREYSVVFKIGSVLAVVVVLVFAACSAGCISVPAETESGHVLLVTVPPMVEIVSSVAGDGFTVRSVVPEGRSPHTYEPTPADLFSSASADIWFTLGAGLLPLEDQVVAKLQDLPRVATGAKVKAVAEKGGEEGEMDPHIWLSARNGMLMTKAVCDGLTARYPELAERFSERTAAYLRQLSDADTRLADAAKTMKPKEFLTTHGSFGYLAEDYSLTQLVIAREGKEPAPQEFAKIVDLAKDDGVHIIVTEPLSGERSAITLSKELGVKPVQINPLSVHYIDTLNSLAKILSSC